MSNGVDVIIAADDIGDGSIDRVTKLLAGIPRGADKAIGSALKRAGIHGEAYAARAVSQEYTISIGDFKKYTQRKRHIISDSGGTTIELEFRGTHIPLLKFDTRVGSDGRVTTRVRRGNPRASLDHVFGATVGSHSGLFEREGVSRFPIEEKFGPSTPQMLGTLEDEGQAVGDEIREAFEKRIDHEMLAVLNGWR